MDKFCLSEKREDENDYACEVPPKQRYLYKEEDVKEFIRLLKREYNENDIYDKNDLIRVLDKLTGYKLTQ